MLRPYQQKAIKDLYEWFEKNPTGNPCLELCTGAGKSHILAKICEDAVTAYNSRVLVLTHQKELIEQDYEKIRLHIDCKETVGIYSAGVGVKEIKDITVAGIQSIYKKAKEVGKISLVIIDECHIVSHKNEGMYRTFINNLMAMNPSLRVVGLTASPFRLGHGYIHEGSALFDGLIRPVGIKDLIKQGYLSVLKSKFTELQLNTDGVKKRGGEFIESELQKIVNTDHNNLTSISEILKYGVNRKSWLIFCTGIAHSETIRDLLKECGITCETISSKTKKADREDILARFKTGEIRCVTNCSVLTTGFDNPMIDLIAMLRPTLSPVLYLQMCGRGLRIHPEKEDCIILDFAANIMEHGPITDVMPPRKKGEKKGEAPVKVCEHCQEIVHLSVKVCPNCGKAFPPPPKPKVRLHQDDIMGLDRKFTMRVSKWRWSKPVSKKGVQMLKVMYEGINLSDLPIPEYFCIYHEGNAGDIARTKLYNLLSRGGIGYQDLIKDVDDVVKVCKKAKPPSSIDYEKNGKFFNVKRVYYEQ